MTTGIIKGKWYRKANPVENKRISDGTEKCTTEKLIAHSHEHTNKPTVSLSIEEEELAKKRWQTVAHTIQEKWKKIAESNEMKICHYDKWILSLK